LQFKAGQKIDCYENLQCNRPAVDCNQPAGCNAIEDSIAISPLVAMQSIDCN